VFFFFNFAVVDLHTLKQQILHASNQLSVQQTLDIPDLRITNIDAQINDFDV
jgi:hypothetical protein